MAPPSKPTKPPSATASSPILSSFYIYNPTLGQTDTTVHQQLIFAYPPIENPTAQDVDRQLRAIGLAQGIVQFARAFSPEEGLKEVRTEKGFSVPVEVERGWWMLATIEVSNPPPSDSITPSLVTQQLHTSYRLMRLHHKSFKHLLRSLSLPDLIQEISPHYTAFAHNFNLSLTSVDLDFDITRWSCYPLEEEQKMSLTGWLRGLKARQEGVVDVLLYRDKNDSGVHYEPRRDGLVFPGLQQGQLSWDNIRDISQFIDSLPTKKDQKEDEEVKQNGDGGQGQGQGKRSVSLPGLSESWDSVVQTSSSLFSALSFGTLPAKRSPLSTEPSKQLPQITATSKDTTQTTETEEGGEWIIGGEKGLRIWLEGPGDENFMNVPISLGNQRSGYLRELASASGQFSPGEDNLVEMEIHIYKFSDLLTVFLISPGTTPPKPKTFIPLLHELSSSTPSSRPPTPLQLKPFLLIHDPQSHLLYTTLPPIPSMSLTSTQPSGSTFSLNPKRPPKRDPWPRDQALEIHSHILRLREYYSRPKGVSSSLKTSTMGFGRKGRGGGSGERAREITAKIGGWFIFRTWIPSDDRPSSLFAEGWYILKAGTSGGIGGQGATGQAHGGQGGSGGLGQAGAGGLGKGDDAGGLEDVARLGREKCRETYALMSTKYHDESDEE